MVIKNPTKYQVSVRITHRVNQSNFLVALVSLFYNHLHLQRQEDIVPRVQQLHLMTLKYNKKRK